MLGACTGGVDIFQQLTLNPKSIDMVLVMANNPSTVAPLFSAQAGLDYYLRVTGIGQGDKATGRKLDSFERSAQRGPAGTTDIVVIM